MKHEKLYLRSTLDYDGVPEYLESLGVDVAGLRRELGLDSETFTNRANIMPWDAVCAFFERVADNLEDRYIGLKLALHANPQFMAIGPVIYMGAVSEDVPSFYKLVSTYQAVRTNGYAYSIEENFEKREVIGRYDIHPRSAVHYQLLENNIAISTLTAKKLIPGFKIKSVSFKHKAPKDLSLYEEIFQAPVHFGADQNLLISDMSYYDLEKNQLAFGFRDLALKAYFNGQTTLEPSAKSSINMFINTILPNIIGTGKSDIETFAQSLNMHSKKLQRLLKDEGHSYSGLLDETRNKLAKSLLINTDLPVATMALLLDYSSDRAFTTAFKRWEGMAPIKYRKENSTKAQSETLSFLM